MRITIIPSGGGQPFVLGDDTQGDYISQDLPDQARTVQEVGFFRGAAKSYFDRMNVSVRVPFTVERVHDSYNDAMIFKYTHADAVPRRGDVQFNHDDLVQRWLPNAVIERVACVYHAGVTTRFTYQINGGQFLTNNPNT